MMNKQIQLSEQQEKALDIVKNIFLTANAGSGKTFILTKRFIKTIIEKDPQISEIAVITFTDAAAGDLLIKISHELDSAINNFKDFKILKRLKNFRDSLFNAKISTIHSFCGDILRRYPIESDVDFNFKIISGYDQNELVNDSIKLTFSEALKSDELNEKIKILISKYEKNNLFRFLSEMINWRFSVIRFYSDSKNLNYEDYNQKIDELYKKYFNDEIEKQNLDDFINALKCLQKFIKDANNSSEYKILVDSIIKKNNDKKFFLFINDIKYLKEKIFRKSGFEYLTTYFKKPPGEEFKHYITKVADYIKQFSSFYEPSEDKDKVRLDECEIDKFRFEDIKLIVNLFFQVHEKYEVAKKNKAVLDFEDILIKCFELLTKHKEVVDDISRNITFLLIDEFQDTDNIQFEIAKIITNNFDENHNIFLIGDEKQSIYGFRNANLEIFNSARQDIKLSNTRLLNESIMSELNDENLGDIVLPENYRILPNIVGFINKYFETLLEVNKNKDSWEVFRNIKYNPLIVGRNSEGFGNVELLITDSTKQEIDAEKIAIRVLMLVEGDEYIYKKDEENAIEIKTKINFNDIAILVRNKKDTKEIEKQFIKNNIPYVLISGIGFFQTEEINDWINYFKFLANPFDDIALLSILRSPFYSLSDEELLKISFSKGGNCFFDRLKDYCKENINSACSEILKDLEHKISMRGNLSFSQIIDEILLSTGFEGVFANSRRNMQIYANINKLHQMAREFESDGFVDLMDFADYIQKNQELEKSESEALVSDFSNSVRIMTIHAAKGLEFPVVFIPKCSKENKLEYISFGEIMFEENSGLIFKYPDVSMNRFTKSSMIGSLIKARQGFNEELRVIYVALTRARDYLIFSGDKKCGKNSILSSITDFFGLKDLAKNNCLNYESKVKFMQSEKGLNGLAERSINCELKILADINFIEPKTEQNDNIDNKFNINIVKEHSDIQDFYFTASQLLTLIQCEYKFLLRYIYNLKSLKELENIKDVDENDLTPIEYGTVFHSVMKNLTMEKYDKSYCEEVIKKSFMQCNLEYENKTGEKIKNNLETLFQNEIINKLLKEKNYSNEYEITVLLDDNYLFGIMDRIIIRDDEVIIIDWKTNNFLNKDKETIGKVINQYNLQLDFYSYLVSRKFSDNKRIQSVIVFVNDLDKMIIKDYEYFDFKKYEEFLLEKIKKIKDLNFVNPNSEKQICEECEYYYNKNCFLNSLNPDGKII